MGRIPMPRFMKVPSMYATSAIGTVSGPIESAV